LLAAAAALLASSAFADESSSDAVIAQLRAENDRLTGELAEAKASAKGAATPGACAELALYSALDGVVFVGRSVDSAVVSASGKSVSGHTGDAIKVVSSASSAARDAILTAAKPALEHESVKPHLAKAQTIVAGALATVNSAVKSGTVAAIVALDPAWKPTSADTAEAMVYVFWTSLALLLSGLLGACCCGGRPENKGGKGGKGGKGKTSSKGSSKVKRA